VNDGKHFADSESQAHKSAPLKTSDDVSAPTISSISFTFKFRDFPSMDDVLGVVNIDNDNNKLSSHDLPSHRSTPLISTTFPLPNDDDDSEDLPLFGRIQCSSPESMWPRLCDGNCRDQDRNSHPSAPHPHVVSN
jgi:hypothetical protein